MLNFICYLLIVIQLKIIIFKKFLILTYDKILILKVKTLFINFYAIQHLKLHLNIFHPKNLYKDFIFEISILSYNLLTI